MLYWGSVRDLPASRQRPTINASRMNKVNAVSERCSHSTELVGVKCHLSLREVITCQAGLNPCPWMHVSDFHWVYLSKNVPCKIYVAWRIVTARVATCILATASCHVQGSSQHGPEYTLPLLIEGVLLGDVIKHHSSSSGDSKHPERKVHLITLRNALRCSDPDAIVQRECKF